MTSQTAQTKTKPPTEHLTPRWECQWWHRGTNPKWMAETVTVAAANRDLARERAARQFGCVSELVTCRYVGNR